MRATLITIMGICGTVSIILGSIYIAKRNSGYSWEKLSKLFLAFLIFLSAALILVFKEFIIPALGIGNTIKFIITPIVIIATFAWLSLVQTIRYFFVFTMRLVIAIIGILGIVCLMLFTLVALLVELTISVIRLTIHIFIFALFGGVEKKEDEYDVKFNILIKNSRVIKIYKGTYFSGIILLIIVVVRALDLMLHNEATNNTIKLLKKIRENFKNN